MFCFQLEKFYETGIGINCLNTSFSHVNYRIFQASGIIVGNVGYIVSFMQRGGKEGRTHLENKFNNAF